MCLLYQKLYSGKYDDGTSFFVTEFCSRGSLRTVLDQQDIEIPVKLGIKFAWDACKGMEFLHTLEPPRLHRDLKAENVLVSDDWTVKITDFGSARLLRSKDVPNSEWVVLPNEIPRLQPAMMSPHSPARTECSTGSHESESDHDDTDRPLLPVAASMSVDVGTLLWLAPEVMSSPQDGAGSNVTTLYGPSADVYSYGILLYEILSRDLPYLNMDELNTQMMSRFKFKELIRGGLRPRLEPNHGYPLWFCEIMARAWSHDPQARPTFVQIGTCFSDDDVQWTVESVTPFHTDMTPLMSQGKDQFSATA